MVFYQLDRMLAQLIVAVVRETSPDAYVLAAVTILSPNLLPSLRLYGITTYARCALPVAFPVF